MNFLEKVLNDPKDLKSIPVKDIDPFTHDFDSESVTDRLYSLYSLLMGDKITNPSYLRVVKIIISKYELEVNFIKLSNRKNIFGENTNLKEEAKKLYLESRNNRLEKLGI